MAIFQKKIIRFLPAIIWMSIIFYFSSGSTSAVPGDSTIRFLILKTFHLIEYAVLYFCFFIAFNNSKKSIFTSYLYAITDEIHQSFTPGREPRFTDTLIDLTGILIGFYLIKKYKPYLTKLFSKYIIGLGE
jgi:VanZ family protein